MKRKRKGKKRVSSSLNVTLSHIFNRKCSLRCRSVCLVLYSFHVVHSSVVHFALLNIFGRIFVLISGDRGARVIPPGTLATWNLLYGCRIPTEKPKPMLPRGLVSAVAYIDAFISMMRDGSVSGVARGDTKVGTNARPPRTAARVIL